MSANSNNVKLTVESQMVNGQVYFFSSITPTLTTAQANMLPSVNLSRGSNKQYRLDNLSAHNGTGATWDGEGVHSAVNQSKYQSRVKNDIEAAWATFKSKLAASEKAAAAPVQNTGRSLFFAANGS